MSHEIIFERRALDSAARFPKEDPGLALVLDTIDKLVQEPRPAGSIAYGSSDLRRLHIGDYRVLYLIEDDAVRIRVTHLDRIA